MLIGRADLRAKYAAEQGWQVDSLFFAKHEQTEGANDLFRWIKVIKKERIDDTKHWFTESVREASKGIGDETVEKSLAYRKRRSNNVKQTSREELQIPVRTLRAGIYMGKCVFPKLMHLCTG